MAGSIGVMVNLRKSEVRSRQSSESVGLILSGTKSSSPHITERTPGTIMPKLSGTCQSFPLKLYAHMSFRWALQYSNTESVILIISNRICAVRAKRRACPSAETVPKHTAAARHRRRPTLEA